MLELAGRPLSRAVHTVDEILELVGGYRELNFKPGDEYLYNNTAFTLLTVVVQRVSGRPFDQFCEERLFKPLGMKRTRWRTDFSEIVENRATAYRLLPNGQFRTHAPFTDVIGNGGLLTTVGDLLIWNANLDNPRVGGRAMVELLETQGAAERRVRHRVRQGALRLRLPRRPRDQPRRVDGGLRGVPGALAGRAAVGGGAVQHDGRRSGGLRSPGGGSLYLADRMKPRPSVRKADVPADTLKAVTGVYRESVTDAVLLRDVRREVQGASSRRLGARADRTCIVRRAAGRAGSTRSTAPRPEP